MTNITNSPQQDGYQTELVSSLAPDVAALTIFVKIAPDYLPTNTPTFAIIDPGKTNAELVKISDYSPGLKTFTIPAAGRAQPLYKGHVAAVQNHGAGAVIMISDNFSFWEEIKAGVNSKLDSTGGNAGTTFDHALSASAWRHWKEGVSMKFADDEQAAVSLKTLANAAGVNDKTKVSAADTTENYLNNKVTVSGTGVVVTKSIVNPGANEVLNIDVMSTAADATVDAPYTAAEDITIGLPVSKTTTNGTVENTIASLLSAAGTESEFSNGNNADYVQTCYVAENKIAVAYQSASGNPLLRIGTVALDKTIAWGGAPTTINAAAGQPVALRYMADNKIAILYNTNAGQGSLKVATIAGTVPTLGAAVNFGAATAMSTHDGNMAIIDTDKVLIVYRDSADGGKGKAICTTVAGTVVGAFGAAVELLTTGAGNATSLLAVAKSGAGKAVAFLKNVTTGKGKGIYIEAAGTVLSVNAEVEFSANNLVDGYPMSADYIVDGRIIFTWVDSTTNFVQARVANVAAFGVVTYPSAALVVNAVASSICPSVYVQSATEAYLAYSEQGATFGQFNKITIAGTVLTKGTQFTFNAGVATVYNSIAKVSSRNKFIIGYKDTADNRGRAEVYQDYDNTSTLSGFAVSTVLSGAALTVRSKGLIGNQVGLVAGTTYFIGSTGAISVTDSKQIKVGVAKDATTLDIAIYTTLVMTKANADTLTDGSNADALHVHSGGAFATSVQLNAINFAGAYSTSTVVNCGFQPSVVQIYYRLCGKAANVEKNSTGIMVYRGVTTEYGVRFYEDSVSSGWVNFNSTSPTAGNGGNENPITSMSVSTLTATGFTLGVSFSAATWSSGAAAFGQFRIIAWK